jgi:hypothetical protein
VKLTQEMIAIFGNVPHDGPLMMGLARMMEIIDPIPHTVTKLYDRDETCWRRSVDDPAVWTTAARSRVATGRVLLDLYGPLKWRDANGNEDFIVKMTDGKGRNG